MFFTFAPFFIDVQYKVIQYLYTVY